MGFLLLMGDKQIRKPLRLVGNFDNPNHLCSPLKNTG